MRNSLATPLPVDGHAPYGNGTERRSEEVSLCNNSLIFLLCGGFRNYESIKTAVAGEKPARWIQHCWSRPFDNFGTSHGFVGILYSSRLILLYSNHSEGRQTVENHLVHIGTSMYARNDVINFHFFAVFIFAEAGLSAKIAKICTQRKFPAQGSRFKVHQ